MDLTAAVAASRREGLVTLRDFLAVTLLETAPDKRGPLVKQLRDVLREIDSLPTVKANPVDELKAKRTKRRAASKDSTPAAGGGQQRARGGRAGGAGGAGS